MNASKVILSCNEKVKDIFMSKYLVSFTKTPSSSNLRVVENNNSFLFHKIGLHALQSITTLTNLYIIRCTLDGDVFKDLVSVLRTHGNLSLLCLYDTKLPHNSLCEVLKFSKFFTSFLLFEKSLQDISMNEISHISANYAQMLLASANKLLAQGASDHQTLAALE